MLTLTRSSTRIKTSRSRKTQIKVLLIYQAKFMPYDIEKVQEKIQKKRDAKLMRKEVADYQKEMKNKSKQSTHYNP